MNPAELAQKIKQAAADSGYADCGITTTEPFTDFETGVEKRMARFPNSAHLYEEMKDRVDPRKNYPWARSIVACVRRYNRYKQPDELKGRIGRNYQFDRRYLDCPDHTVQEEFERKLNDFGLRFERGTLPDRWVGVRAGVVTFGRNNFAFSEEHGSWINVMAWLIDAELPPDEPSYGDSCPENCKACISACPTGALSEPFTMCMDRCIAYLSYRGSAPTDEDTERQMGEWIYGCDACQDVCPRNKGKWEETIEPDWLQPYLPYLTPSTLARMDLQTYREKVHPLFWYIDDSEHGLERWRANANRSLRNAGMENESDRLSQD